MEIQEKFVLISIFLILLFSFFIVSAQEEAKYSFGSMQADKELSIKPGQSAETKLYFYNLYGNRATHIKLSVEEKPENWQVEINPFVKSMDYNVAGIITTVEENLYVAPSNPLEEPGLDTEEIEYISSKVGYIEANFVTLKIKVPENEKIGKNEKININAIAFWLGQGGTTALQQERDFEYTIKTISETFYEKPFEKIAEEEEVEAEGEGNIARISGAIIGTNLSTGVLAVTSFILVIVILFLLVRIKRIKQAEKVKK